MSGTFENPEIIEESVDILLIGGGMGACGAAYELGPWIEACGEDINDGPIRCGRGDADSMT